MSRVREVTGNKVMYGNNVSHANNKGIDSVIKDLMAEGRKF